MAFPVFTNPFTMNNVTSNWLALPALPAGTPNRGTVTVSAADPFFIGACTAGQATADGGYLYIGETATLCRVSFPVDDYDRLTVRHTAASTQSCFVMFHPASDERPNGAV